MALVLTETQRNIIKSQFDQEKRVVQGTAAFDTSYPTGGEAVLLSQIGTRTVDFFYAFPFNGFTFLYDSAAVKLKAFSSSGTEVANTTDLSALTAVPVLVSTRPVSPPKATVTLESFETVAASSSAELA